MNEYISREELIKALETDYNRSWCSKPQGSEEYVEGVRYAEGVRDEYDDVLKIICAMAAADVQPVKRAEWIGFTRSAFLCCDHTGEPIYRDTTVWKCSRCGRNTVVRDNFCPICGARMGGEKP